MDSGFLFYSMGYNPLLSLFILMVKFLVPDLDSSSSYKLTSVSFCYVLSSFKQFLTFKAIKCSNLISYLSYPSSVHQPFLKGGALVLFSGESYLEIVPVLLSATGISLRTVLFWKENKVKWNENITWKVENQEQVSVLKCVSQYKHVNSHV